MLMASQIGGAIAPLLVVPIQMRYGWRDVVLVFGVVGASGRWPGTVVPRFAGRDAGPLRLGARELDVAPRRATASRGGWPAIETCWRCSALAFCYIYVYTFFQTWFHTFLVRGRGFSEAGLLLSALPYVVAACANLGGGAASDALVRRLGREWGRRAHRRRGAAGAAAVHARGDAHARSSC